MVPVMPTSAIGIDTETPSVSEKDALSCGPLESSMYNPSMSEIGL